MPDVRMPDGTIIRNVKPGTSRATLESMWKERKLQRQVAEHPIAGPVTSFFSGLADMATMGGGDEISATLDTLNPFHSGPTVYNSGWSKAWSANQRAHEKRDQELAKTSPTANLTGQVAGVVVPAVVTGGASLPRIAPQAPRLVRTARAVAPTVAQSAAYGFNSGHGGVAERAQEIPEAVAWGLGGQAAGHLAGRTFARILGGQQVSPQVQALADAGVILTPGQRAGPRSFTNTAEQMFASLPIAGWMVKGARSRGVAPLNEAIVNEGLAPIGATVAQGGGVNRNVMGAAMDTATDALNTSTQPLSLSMDNLLQNEIDAIRQRAPGTVGPLAGQLDSTIGDIVDWRLQNGGATGRDVQNMLSDLRQSGANFRSSAGANERNLGTQIGAVEDAVMDGIERTTGDPQAIQAFRDARTAYGNMKRLNVGAARATEGRLGEGALMSPSQILSAVKTPGYGVTADRVARGDAPMQTLAEAGAAILPDTVPNSGTVDRGLLTALAGAGLSGGAGAYADEGNVGTASLAALPFLLYTPSGQRALQNLALQRPEALRQIATGVRRNAGIFGSAGTATLLPFSGE